MALIAHVLHTPVTVLEDAEIVQVLEWADDAADLVARLTRKVK